MKNFIKTVTVILAAFVFFSFQTEEKNSSSETIPQARWVKLGKRQVSKGADHDVLMVTGNKGKFRKLRFKITNSPVYIANIRVVFGDGSSQNITINENLRKGTMSRVIDLKGKRRVIKKIIFNYHTKFFAKGKARIHVFGGH
jgi:hypothetical protein